VAQRRSRSILAAALVAAGVAWSVPAAADEYDAKRAGHPLRIVAYVLHPIGVAFDYLLFRPAHWVGHQQPFRTLFGHRDESHGEP
jgi:hypothetical protein